MRGNENVTAAAVSNTSKKTLRMMALRSLMTRQ
jgi:hypothetical protein